MNVASLELSKQLWELTKWNVPFTVPESSTAAYTYIINDNVPRYDSGFLLRKLPEIVDAKSQPDGFANLRLEVDVQGTWHASYFPVLDQEADTPEDALCQLALELVKQGVLK